MDHCEMEDQSQTGGGSQEVPTMAVLQQAAPAVDQDEDTNAMTIARRTRSQFSIEDSVLVDNLNFPDIDEGLYQSADSEGDPMYRQFLCQTFADSFGNDNDSTIDTNAEDNDPPYVFNDDIFCPGWRFDLDEELQQKIDLFNEPEFKRILNQQLRQHIQLLTQTYLLTKNAKNMQDEAAETKGYLEAYMKIFKNKSKPSNLLPAIELVNSYGSSNLESYVRSSWRPLSIPEPARALLDTRRDIFMYKNLLPETAFSIRLLPPDRLVAKKPKKPKILFTPSEDKLLAYALNEFERESSLKLAYIASLLMAAKTKMEISNHIKTIKRSPKEDNPVKQFFSSKLVPRVDLDADAELRDSLSSDEHGIDHFDHDAKQREQEQQQQLQQQQHEHQADQEQLGRPEQEPEPEREQPQHVGQVSCENESVTHEKFDSECGDRMFEHHFADYQLQSARGPQPTTESQAIQNPSPESEDPPAYSHNDDVMNMTLDDLMAASTTICTKTAISLTNGTGCNNSSINNNSGTISERNIKNMKLRSSMLELMTSHFSLSETMGGLIIEEFIHASRAKLCERDHLHLLQLLTDLMRKEARKPESVVTIHKEISRFLNKINAPSEFHERLVLLLNLEQATKCGCAFSYLHWMRFFEFIHHVELHHDGEAIEKKLMRLIDALTKDDSHKVKLAAANLINKHTLLKRDFDSLELDGKPHSSLFLCDEDFDDITEPLAVFQSRDASEQDAGAIDDVLRSEHFELKPTSNELNFASPSCPCNCHNNHNTDDKQQRLSIASSNGGGGDQHSNMELGQHCNKCNLKFMKGRMYLVNKIKPFLAEWSYVSTPPPSEVSTSSPTTTCDHQELKWTYEEDKEILEFCRAKAEQNGENISFDTSTFEELVSRKRKAAGDDSGTYKKSSHQIAERFNHLMEMYRIEEASLLQLG